MIGSSTAGEAMLDIAPTTIVSRALAVWPAVLLFPSGPSIPASAPFGGLIPLLSFCADSLQAIEINGGGSFGVQFLTTSLY